MFQQTFVEQGNKTRKGASVFVSFVVQVTVIVVFVLIPLIYTEILPKATINAFLMAPPPPPPPAPPPPPVTPHLVKASPRVFEMGHLRAPTSIPESVAILVDDSMPPLAGPGGVVGSIPGGIPGGPGGVISGIMTTVSAPPPPPPAVKELKQTTLQRVVVGGQVQQARLIRQVKPNYPPLARQARISGVVRFTAIIGKDGTIQNLQLVSGHPLLVPAASDAVKQWLYKPTYLNTEPVEVITQIEVNFTLNQN